ncbi:hypothetical protein [Sphingorhabdus sp.]|uniref:hypothetical protein n=1 Tax=Sphingorhabdus sp. TaxID=1902408 RepID=UPI0032B7D971
MTRRSQRLRRVLRKYELDARMVRLETAKAERERNALSATARRLDAARSGILFENRAMTGDQLAALGEWSERLLAASIAIQPSIQNAEVTFREAVQDMRQAKGRVERIEERILRTSRIEDRLREDRTAIGKSLPKAKQEPQP